VESKKNSDTVATVGLRWQVTIHYNVYYSLQCSLFPIDFSFSKSVDSDSATAELGTQQRMVAE
jgi:hypothetical protein